MNAGDTAQRASTLEVRNTLCCRWERTAFGSLIGKWRAQNPGIPLSEARAVHAQRRADRQRLSSPRRRTIARLTAAAAIVALYCFIGFTLVSAFVGRNSAW